MCWSLRDTPPEEKKREEDSDCCAITTRDKQHLARGGRGQELVLNTTGTPRDMPLEQFPLTIITAVVPFVPLLGRGENGGRGTFGVGVLGDTEPELFRR